jgi:hypothetical protein
VSGPPLGLTQPFIKLMGALRQDGLADETVGRNITLTLKKFDLQNNLSFNRFGSEVFTALTMK